ncbi:DoxX family protein [Staphylococcus saprophyticus]|uniref:DoxX family protein n=1 Tax=Staphylococcus TaxID=1279 RepID=UPI00055C413E|nr:DoxX family protein [Staphylococcus saprophyticus]MCC4220367.1 DoxX family protein [Staphylococcus saprophyticus]SUM65111.1 DoxX family protein [Staphylococcus saprophyticus]SUM75759.1 DoxX family protein [Staphylococcus saprophyticus]SUM78276.1 DoxX family protein [Staphylococcus saprophyticus]VDZ24371.1 DoxX family protein [Staphylococcus saprophyticus]
MKFGILLIRLMLGIVFMVHGGQKVLGGFSEPMAMMEGLGFPAFFGIVLGLFELIGGILLFFGILTNYIASGFIIIMLGALFTVHLKEGYMASEFVLTLLVMSISMIVSYNWKKFVQFY